MEFNSKKRKKELINLIKKNPNNKDIIKSEIMVKERKINVLRIDNKDYISDVINKMYVSDLLKCLDRDELLVIRLRIWNGFIFEEITDIMNSFYIAEASDKRISLSGVYKIYRRALGKLQKKCEED